MAERSRDWFRQAVHDLSHAKSAADTGDHDWACFAAQQAAEKALEADSREAIDHAEQVIGFVRRRLS